MNKRNKVVAGVIVLALLVGGGIMVFGKDKKDDSQSTSQTLGGALTAYSGSYSATITSTRSGKTASTITIAVKDSDTYSITTGGSEGKSKFILDGTDFYIQGRDDEWVKYPSTQAASAAPTLAVFTSYLQSADLLARYTGATVNGDASCSIGSCKLYVYAAPGTNETVFIFVDKSNGRIVEIVTKLANGDETRISYDYSTAVDIQVPKNAKTISIPAQ